MVIGFFIYCYMLSVHLFSIAQQEHEFIYKIQLFTTLHFGNSWTTIV